MKRPRKLRPYFLHNIDGRHCGVVWAHSKVDVSRALRVAQSEIQDASADKWPAWMQHGLNAAEAEPGRLFRQRITTHSNAWEPDPSARRVPVEGVTP